MSQDVVGMNSDIPSVDGGQIADHVYAESYAQLLMWPQSDQSAYFIHQ